MEDNRKSQKRPLVINHLLVIDDDQMTEVLIDGISNNLNLVNRYILQTDGWKALEYLAFCKKTQDFPDLIILDLRMPIMGGLEFLEKYERQFYPEYKDTKIVIATNSTTKDEKEAATSHLSIDLFLHKPLVKEKFLHLHETLFGVSIAENQVY